ncbi:MAG: peptide deformylase [Armatimonadetes bacterium]|nr:peptide deformylase [Armatimonadota bacterium]
MGVDEIVRYGKKILTEPTGEVPELNEEIRSLIEHMYEVMDQANGVGLAANQIGVPLRLFVYDIGEGPRAMINPKIVKKSGSQVGTEGCLSIPGLHGDVERANTATVEGLDENGNKVKISGEGLLARVFQHEIDHLNGVLFIDRADVATLHWAIGEQENEEE